MSEEYELKNKEYKKHKLLKSIFIIISIILVLFIIIYYYYNYICNLS